MGLYSDIVEKIQEQELPSNKGYEIYGIIGGPGAFHSFSGWNQAKADHVKQFWASKTRETSVWEIPNQRIYDNILDNSLRLIYRRNNVLEIMRQISSKVLSDRLEIYTIDLTEEITLIDTVLQEQKETYRKNRKKVSLSAVEKEEDKQCLINEVIGSAINYLNEPQHYERKIVELLVNDCASIIKNSNLVSHTINNAHGDYVITYVSNYLHSINTIKPCHKCGQPTLEKLNYCLFCFNEKEGANHGKL